MYFRQVKNLLPKKIADGAALKTSIFKHQLFGFRGFKKLTKISHFSRLTKLSLGVILLLYFSGYQPTLAIPPIKQSIVQADFTQKENIESGSFNQPFNLPHPGYLTTRFSAWHPGIDIATGYGMPVHPVSGGKVIEVVYGFFGLGHYIVIQHEEGFKSTYGHMGRIFVKKDDLVTANSILGEVGVTGHTTGPHTHLEITRNGQYIDPQTILPTISNWPNPAGQIPQGQGEIHITPTPVKLEPTLAPSKIKLLSLGQLEPSNQDNKIVKLPTLLTSQLDKY